MSDDAKRFRDRAKDCRRLARETFSATAKKELNDIAEELDTEADKIEAEERTPD
jgi:hypothetical protein